MVTRTIESFYLGTFSDLDPNEANFASENSSILVGATFGSSGAPLYDNIDSLTVNDLNSDGQLLENDNGQSADQLIYGGISSDIDSAIDYNVLVTYSDGTTATTQMLILQDTSGRVFLNPYREGDPANNVLDDKPIESIQLTSVIGDNYSFAFADLEQDAFIDATVDGTAGNDSIGASYIDADGTQMNAYGGDDIVDAGAGDDTIYAVAGNDSIVAGAGNDIVYGGSGSDTLIGGDGKDTIYGGTEADLMTGGAGDDVFVTGAGDTAQGGTGDDTFYNYAPEGIGGTISIIGGEGDEDGNGDWLRLTFEDGGAWENDPLTVTLTSSEAGSVTGGSSTINFSEIEFISTGLGNDTIDLSSGSTGMRIDASSGDDSVTGGTGADTIDGGIGNDVLSGGAGADTIDGGTGDDVLDGGGGADTIDGGSGNDTLLANFGADTFIGGAGIDTYDIVNSDASYVNFNIDLTTGTDQHGNTYSGIENILGGTANDSLTGDGANNLLDGGAGADTISGGTGADSLSGGDDADTFVVEDGFGADTIIGGEGVTTGTDYDTIDLSAVTNPVTVTFTGSGAGTISDGTSTLSFSQIERLILGASADVVDITSDTGGMEIIAGAGNDTVTGGSGNDTIAGGDGDDLIDGGDGDDFLTTGLGNDTLIGGSGNDTLMNSDGDDSLVGGAGNDSIVATGGNDTLEGNDGDDTLEGGADNDRLVGGTGADSMSGGDDADTFVIEDNFGADTIIGGEGVTTGTDYDTLDLSAVTVPVTVTFTGTGAGTISDGTSTLTFSEIERVILGDSADVVDATNDAGGIEIIAGGGNDTVTGGSGNDTIDGGDGEDTIDGGAGNDSLLGGLGADTISGGAGADTIDGGNQSDLILGGDGNDVIIDSGLNLSDDTIDGGLGDDTIDGGLGKDSLTGGDGNDSIAGGDGQDTLQGGDGADSLDGGNNNDVIDGGAGADTITGGTGADTIEGGTGDDVIDLGADSDRDILGVSDLAGSDIVTNFDMTDSGDGTTVDQFDVSNLVDADGNPVNAWDVVVSDTNGDGTGDAVLTFVNGESVTLVGVQRSQVDNAQKLNSMGIPCFTPGTMIATPSGETKIETLKPGDLVTTLEYGPMPIRWLALSEVAVKTASLPQNLTPVRIRPGVLGNARALVVSPQHCVLLTDQLTNASYYVRAKHLAEETTLASFARGRQSVTYIHLMLDKHATLISNDIPSESFYPGPMAMKMMSAVTRLELYALLPELDQMPVEQAFGTRAATVLSRNELQKLNGRLGLLQGRRLAGTPPYWTHSHRGRETGSPLRFHPITNRSFCVENVDR
ncbi:Hint domain-containing protein [Phaeobacter sp. A36a-5a]|uniref:Hint domain-containing protein n=1 Tax=Phaeobacter bryozoorum TaxID=1086632 RepID=UPI0030CA0B46